MPILSFFQYLLRKVLLSLTRIKVASPKSSKPDPIGVQPTPMNTHDLLMLILMLSPGLVLSAAIMATFAAGG
jgi:hypothetical protein